MNHYKINEIIRHFLIKQLKNERMIQNELVESLNDIKTLTLSRYFTLQSISSL